MIVCFLSNISAKYYKNLSMLSRVIAENVGNVFLDTVYIAFDRSKIGIFGYPFVFNSPDGVVPLGRSPYN